MLSSNFSRSWQKGFTLIELLVALLISSITITALLSFFSLQTKSMRAENARRAAQITARGTLSFIVRELEHLGRDPHNSLFSRDNPALQEANEDNLHYRANLSQDWATDTNPAWEDVTFRYNPAEWEIEVVRNGAEVALTDDRGDQQKSYVPHGGLVFTYFDSDGNEVAPGGDAAARASIRRINIFLAVRGVPPWGYYDEPEVTLSQDVILRNVAN